MEIKKFDSFLNINEEKYVDGDKSFEEKLREDDEIIDIIKGIIVLGLEKINDTKDVHNSDEFRDELLDSINVDATDLVSFDLSKQIDLCIYYESSGGEGCPECEWDDLAQKINDSAISGLITITSDIIEEIFINEFNDFMEENDLDYNNISWKDTFGYASHVSEKSINNGTIYKYRKLDGEYNIDVYHYVNSELNINLYIKKEIK